MPSVLLKHIEDLVKQGFYKNKSEAIIDAVIEKLFKKDERYIATHGFINSDPEEMFAL